MLFFRPLTTIAVSSLLLRELEPLAVSLPLADDISSTPEWYAALLLIAAPTADSGFTMALPDVTT